MNMEKILRKLNGHRPSHRNKWFLVQMGILNMQEMSFYDYCADLTDFDHKHQQYGTFELDFSTCSSFLNVSQNTVRNWANYLIYLGLMEKVEKERYRIKNFERYIAQSKQWQGTSNTCSQKEKSQSVGIIFQALGIDLQTAVEKSQQVGRKPSKNLEIQTSRYLGSSKEESMSYHLSRDISDDIPF